MHFKLNFGVQMKGLKLMWNLGYRSIMLKSDLKELISMLTQGEMDNINICRMHKECCRLLAKEWNVEIQHTYKEGNKCADWLARYNLSQAYGVFVLQEPLAKLQLLLLIDAMGVTTPRVVFM